MDAARTANGRAQPLGTRRSTDRHSPDAMPQPGLRLLGLASIGVGSGLFNSSMPPEVLVLAFAPAVLAILVIAVQSTFAKSAVPSAELISDEERHG
jgi:hypothetical protein